MQIVCIRQCSTGNRRIEVGEKFKLSTSHNLTRLKMYDIRLFSMDGEFITNIGDEDTLCRYFEDVK